MLRITALFLLCFAAFVARANECSEPLVVSYTGDWKPFFYRLNKTNFDGEDFRLLSQVTKSMLCKIDVLPMTERRAIIELSKGTFDIIICASITEERKKHFHFSQPYREEVTGVLYRRQTSVTPPDSLEEILSREGVVAVNMAGFFGMHLENLKQRYPNQFVHKVNPERRLTALINNEIDAIVDDRVALCHQLKQVRESNNSAKPKRQTAELSLSGEMLNQTNIHFMFSRKTISKTLIERFNQYLSQHLQSRNLPDFTCSE